ncbi:MAG: SRPBCC family protein [Pseudomonadota bacterium]
MLRQVQLCHDYAFPAQTVWHVATDLDHLQTVTEGFLAFRDLPSGTISEGQTLDVQVSLMRLLPYQPYRMQVLHVDDTQMSFASEEQGVGVKVWRHSLQVFPTGTGAQIREAIEIDAGWKTPFFLDWARFMYRRRHPRRVNILRQLKDKGGPR